MGSKAPSPPNYAPIAAASDAAAQLQYQLGQQQLQWAKDQFAQNSATTQQVVNSFLNAQNLNQAAAQKQQQQYQTTFAPLNKTLADQATAYNTPARQTQAAGQAEAGVSQAFDQQRNAAQQQLEGFGIDPSSTRFAALDIGTRNAQAAATAGAGNQAIQQTQQTGLGLLSNAVNVGAGFPAQVATTYGTANQAGSGAVSAGNATTATGAQTMGTPSQFFGGANAALGTWGNALNQGYANALSASQQSSGLGSLLGLGLSFAATGGPIHSPFEEAFAMGGGAAPPPSGAAAPSPPNMPTPGGAIPPGASPTAGQATDDVPAKLTAGEFVIPKDVVNWKGEQFFQNLIMQARKQSQPGGPQAPAQPTQGQGVPTGPPTFTSQPGQPQQGVPAR
jgi:hypothetical protein